MKLGDTLRLLVPRNLYLRCFDVEPVMYINLDTPELLQAAQREDWELVLTLHADAARIVEAKTFLM